jgi:predicted nuclease of predicted toxin-antitoxin system
MRRLFDQNLSPSLPRRLAAEFPDSLHVREAGLSEAEDAVIWNYARLHGLAIVSKDSDFQQRSLLLGAPPKFIWLRIGNCSVADSAELLRPYATSLRAFAEAA